MEKGKSLIAPPAHLCILGVVGISLSSDQCFVAFIYLGEPLTSFRYFRNGGVGSVCELCVKPAFCGCNLIKSEDQKVQRNDRSREFPAALPPHTTYCQVLE